MPPTHLRGLAAGSLLFLATAFASSPAHATPGERELQAARDLFAQAEQDEDAGRWQDALAKLRGVAQVRLTAGIRYHMALCEEHGGRLASALADFSAAEVQAIAENAQDVLRLVGVEMAPLVSRVPRLEIRVIPELATATVMLDGVVVAPEHLDSTLTLDPGTHRVEATAPGHAITRVAVTMHERDATFLDVVLQPVTPNSAGVGTAAQGPLGPASSPNEPTLTAPIVATALAVAFAGAGVAAYFVADGAHTDAVRDCANNESPADDACDSLKSPVRTWDWVAAGAWTGATLSAVIAAFLWARPSREDVPRGLTHVVLGPGSVGAVGSF